MPTIVSLFSLLREGLKNERIEPGTKTYERLKGLSDRLSELQDKDFEARQIKDEIDRALKQGSGGALMKMFSTSSFDDD